jgi:L-lysine 2,3-aminomutase
MKASEFDKKFDEGEDITGMLDLEKARRSSRITKRVNVDIPTCMIRLLDKEAKRLGVTRQSVIKFWLAEKLEKSP